ncbi:hypothetical protein D9Q98_005789 [Chlorella vulgaris]|uniref:RBR-type E3 ubiquitin transferase n=1 Tax=Chlorella vulgaris TaxID=3077 RepID=A0A9D4TMR2_CHLVU|nr:hypothetical protein D9Q98_005789 [Chlorella vulgaris]
MEGGSAGGPVVIDLTDVQPRARSRNLHWRNAFVDLVGLDSAAAGAAAAPPKAVAQPQSQRGAPAIDLTDDEPWAELQPAKRRKGEASLRGRAQLAAAAASSEQKGRAPEQQARKQAQQQHQMQTPQQQQAQKQAQQQHEMQAPQQQQLPKQAQQQHQMQAPQQQQQPKQALQQQQEQQQPLNVEVAGEEGGEGPCSICFEDEGPMMHSFAACKHRFCLPCLRQFIAGKVADRTFPLCPLPDCKSAISAAECALVLTEEEQATLGKMEAEAAVGDGARLFCPNPSCSQLLIADDKQEDTALECPYCTHQLCANCGVAWHKDLTCRQYQALPGAVRSKAEQALLDMAEEQGMRRCGTVFCYSCGASKAKGSSHYCTCKPHAEQWLRLPGTAAAAAAPQPAGAVQAAAAAAAAAARADAALAAALRRANRRREGAEQAPAGRKQRAQQRAQQMQEHAEHVAQLLQEMDQQAAARREARQQQQQQQQQQPPGSGGRRARNREGRNRPQSAGMGW